MKVVLFLDTSHVCSYNGFVLFILIMLCYVYIGSLFRLLLSPSFHLNFHVPNSCRLLWRMRGLKESSKKLRVAAKCLFQRAKVITLIKCYFHYPAKSNWSSTVALTISNYIIVCFSFPLLLDTYTNRTETVQAPELNFSSAELSAKALRRAISAICNVQSM